MDDLRKKVEHLKLAQGVVTRMAGNSLQMKTWSVSLVTAAFAFSGLSDDPHWLVAVGGCIPIAAFWTMDARYLHLERCYIRLYDEIVAGAPVAPFALNYRAYVGEVDSVWRIALSWSVCLYYGALLALMLFLFIILRTTGT